MSKSKAKKKKKNNNVIKKEVTINKKQMKSLNKYYTILFYLKIKIHYLSWMFLGNKNKYSINVFYLSILLRYFHLFVFRKTSFEVKFLIFKLLKNFI